MSSGSQSSAIRLEASGISKFATFTKPTMADTRANSTPVMVMLPLIYWFALRQRKEFTKIAFLDNLNFFIKFLEN